MQRRWKREISRHVATDGRWRWMDEKSHKPSPVSCEPSTSSASALASARSSLDRGSVQSSTLDPSRGRFCLFPPSPHSTRTSLPFKAALALLARERTLFPERTPSKNSSRSLLCMRSAPSQAPPRPDLAERPFGSPDLPHRICVAALSPSFGRKSLKA